MTGYDEESWWSGVICKTPKVVWLGVKSNGKWLLGIKNTGCEDLDDLFTIDIYLERYWHILKNTIYANELKAMMLGNLSNWG